MAMLLNTVVKSLISARMSTRTTMFGAKALGCKIYWAKLITIVTMRASLGQTCPCRRACLLEI